MILALMMPSALDELTRTSGHVHTSSKEQAISGDSCGLKMLWQMFYSPSPAASWKELSGTLEIVTTSSTALLRALHCPLPYTLDWTNSGSN